MKILLLASAIFASLWGSVACDQTGGFTTRDGRIYAPDQTEFIARGINVRPEDMEVVARTVTNLFPGINFIRLAIDNGNIPRHPNCGFLSCK
jgi:hypothetical protein